MEFKSVTRRDLARLRRYYKTCDYVLCEYSAMVKLMWREHLHPAWTEAAGCLIVYNLIDGGIYFDYPVPGPDGDEEVHTAALHIAVDDRAPSSFNPVINISQTQTLSIVVLAELMVTLLNTGVISVDSKLYGYYTPALITGSLALRLVICVGKAVAYSFALPPLLLALRRAASVGKSGGVA